MPKAPSLTQKMFVAAKTVDAETGQVVHHLRPQGNSGNALAIHSADYITTAKNALNEFSEVDITVTAKPAPKGAQK